MIDAEPRAPGAEIDVIVARGYPVVVLRRAPGLASLPLAIASLVLSSMLLGAHGLGALASDDDCACDAAAALDVEDPHDDCSEDELGGESEDTCPPGCDCPCCGSPIVGAQTSSLSLVPLGAIALSVPRDGSRDAPSVARDGVFRPPRA